MGIRIILASELHMRVHIGRIRSFGFKAEGSNYQHAKRERKNDINTNKKDNGQIINM